MRIRFGVIFGVLLLGLLAGCGFHPAGSRPLPAVLKKVHVDVVVPYRVSETPLETSLRTRLLRQGAKVTKDAEGALCTIKLSNLKEGRQVLSVGPDGKALEFLLVTTVDYQVFSGSEVLVAPGTLRVTRDYQFRDDQILAKEAEEERLREYIQDQLAELLLLKIETQLGRKELEVKSPATTPTPEAKPAVEPAPAPPVSEPAAP